MQAAPGRHADQDEVQWQAIQAGAWPFEQVCGQCCADLVDPAWEIRHGAAVGLREVLRSHAFAAGVHAPVSAQPSGNGPSGQT